MSWGAGGNGCCTFKCAAAQGRLLFMPGVVTSVPWQLTSTEQTKTLQPRAPVTRDGASSIDRAGGDAEQSVGRSGANNPPATMQSKAMGGAAPVTRAGDDAEQVDGEAAPVTLAPATMSNLTLVTEPAAQR